MTKSQIFLERHSYRMRRTMDAVRLLPLLGLGLCLVPLMWPGAADPETGVAPVPTSTALRYLFAVWLGLVAASALLWRRTRGRSDAVPDADRSEAG